MHTLSTWARRLAAAPLTLECPAMQLFGSHDGDPAVFTGPGRIEVVNEQLIRFMMHASTGDVPDAIGRLRACDEAPYSTEHGFRLVATDYEGTEWNGGWTRPRLSGSPRVGLPLRGELAALTTIATGHWVSQEPGVELLFAPSLRLPMEEALVTESRYGEEQVETSRRDGRQVLQVLDAEVVFARDPSRDMLWLTAGTSAKLRHPYAENWLVEPLHVLLGEFAFPRLVARNFGDGRALVTLRQSPQLKLDVCFASVLADDPLGRRAELWQFYCDYLTYIAGARDSKGHENFEANAITQYYLEIIRAVRGSRWVQCMTVASCAEGLAKLLMADRRLEPPFPESAIASFEAYVRDWSGNQGLRDRVMGDVARLRQSTIGRFLRDLVQTGLLEEAHADAWNRVRHSVMHGNLVQPWGSEEDDTQLRALAELVHRLTKAVVGGAHP